MSAMKRYRVILVSREYYEFEVEAGTEQDARTLAVMRKDSGDWGKPLEFPNVEIYDMEVVK
jgi:hypothetical protein